MRTARRRGLASALSLTLLAGLALAATPAAAGAEINNDYDKVFVLNNNIENRKCSKYNFQTLLDSVRDSKILPDVLTFQQVGGTKDLNHIKNMLETTWGVKYEGVLSFPDFDPQLNAACPQNKTHQANAVLWQEGRFKLATPKKIGDEPFRMWKSDSKIKENGAWSSCKNLPPSIRTKINGENVTLDLNHERSINVAVALADKKNDRVVVVASVHWPRRSKTTDDTAEGRARAELMNPHACLKENMQEAEHALDVLIGAVKGGSMTKSPKVIGGDMNAKTSIEGWWKFATENLKFIDPIAVNCKEDEDMAKYYPNCSGPSDPGSEAERDWLNKDHRTTQVNRIDYVLIKNARTTKAASTVKQPLTGKLYSNHRAVRVTVKY